MRTYHSNLFVFVIMASLLIFSCSNNKSTDNSTETAKEEVATATPAVCVYDWSANGLQVLEDFNNPKSHETFVKLGETVKYLGETSTDTINKRNYCKIELSDGTKGWTRSDYIINNATRGAIITNTPVYERPDILTKSSKKSYDAIDLVVITEGKDGWYNVTGRNNQNTGWVQKENISVNKEDVDMSILARKEVMDSKGNIIDEKLNDFINNAPYQSSKIVELLKNRLFEIMEKNNESDDVEESTMDIEEDAELD